MHYKWKTKKERVQVINKPDEKAPDYYGYKE